MSHLSLLPPLLSPIFLEEQNEKKCFKPKQAWRRVKWRAQSGLMLCPKLPIPRSKAICNESLHKTKYSDYCNPWLFRACLHSTECLVEADFCPASDCQEADVGSLTSHRDFCSQVCKSGTYSKVCLSELLQNKTCAVGILALEPSPWDFCG